MTKTSEDLGLEPFFEAGRETVAAPSAEFMARLTLDAEAHLPQPVAAPARAPERRSVWRMFEAWGGFAALASTAATGVWIGAAMPASMDVPGAELVGIGTDVSLLLPGYGTDFLVEE